MSLLGSGFRETLTGRMFGSTNVNGANPHSQEYRGHMTARMRNQFAGAGITDPTASVPSGVRPPVAWVMALKNGAMSSRNLTEMTFSGAGLAVGGVTSPGFAELSITVADVTAFPLDTASPLRTGSAGFNISFSNATGQLISSGSGNASMGFNFANALLTASIGGFGTAGMTFGATGSLGAIASNIGTASFSINIANAQAYPLNDASPLRTGTASFAVSGSLVPYAKGIMQGSTNNSEVLTATDIANKVWSSIASEFLTAGTMGSKLNSASGGGGGGTVEVDAAEIAAAVRVELAAELALLDRAISSRVAAGDTIGANILYIRGQAISGTGTSDNPWRPS